MLSYIKGLLEEISEDMIVIEANHVGFSIQVPSSIFKELPNIGESIKIYTYLYVREDAMVLFGFITKDDMEIFKKLITVNGIGPKGAMGILSVMTGYELRVAIMSNDLNRICLAPGIGKKTAQKLILDLKDKLKLIDFEDGMDGSVTEKTINPSLRYADEGVEALVALGYSSHEAIHAVKGLHDLDSVEAVIKEALKKLAMF
ncbi:Holliday junction branch migration protein RuvA [Petrocella sp. FN5]|uniref:Holliday junction branch migration protein RuvA n=1 Tax=Petrocella sp. FN5 TaxID=3032002 RepID=UPI0023DCDE1E|nr:Holliday junction branch migration protein RuvA [Petrocella sp. FN5]MDF1618465.1 Holliday junction branch migration protein RuvA [Petrocella sp. FN5]